MLIFDQREPRQRAKKAEQCLRINFKEEPTCLDPRKGRHMCGASQVHAMLFEGLMRLEPDGSLSCAQAKSYDISPDQKCYTFHLRDTFWSDGSPVTAHDFAHTWKNILDPSFPSRDTHSFFFIKNAEAVKNGELPLDQVGITVKDAKTLHVELEKPIHYFLQIIASSTFFPVNQNQDRDFPDWYLEAGEHFVCNGPFKLADWKHNHEMLLKKNKHYHRSEEIKLDSIHISYINKGIAPLHIDAAGLFDIIGPPISVLPHDLLRELSQKNLLQIVSMPGIANCTFNTHRFPFHNVNIRKAFSYAIDRKFLVSTITVLKEQLALGAIPPMLKKQAIQPFFKDNDIKNARAHLQKGMKELGITPRDLDDKLTFSFWKKDYACPMIPQALQKQWEEKLGVNVQLEALDFKALHDKGKNNLLSMGYFVPVSMACDPIDLLSRFKFAAGSRNYACWQNDTYVDLLNQAEQSASQEERFVLLEQAEKLLMDEMPIAPLFYWNNAFLVQPHVQGFAISPLGYLCLDRISIKRPS